MKKCVLVSILILLLPVVAPAEIQGLQFEAKAFDDSSYLIGVYDNMKQVAVKPMESQSYDYAFKDKSDRYEIRYTLFSQIGAIEDYRLQVTTWAMIVAQNIAGNESAVKSSTAFKDDDVKKEFNADYGLTSFVLGGQSDFTEGFKYGMINFFYKKKLGIMCQTVLFNDIGWIKTIEFLDEFHSFKYK